MLHFINPVPLEYPFIHIVATVYKYCTVSTDNLVNTIFSKYCIRTWLIVQDVSLDLTDDIQGKTASPYCVG